LVVVNIKNALLPRPSRTVVLLLEIIVALLNGEDVVDSNPLPMTTSIFDYWFNTILNIWRYFKKGTPSICGRSR
jgi:hypothetical protein